MYGVCPLKEVEKMSRKILWGWFLTFWMVLALFCASVRPNTKGFTQDPLIIGYILFVVIWIIFGLAWDKYKHPVVPKPKPVRLPFNIRFEPSKEVPEITFAEEEEEDEFEEDFLITEITEEEEDEPI